MIDETEYKDLRAKCDAMHREKIAQADNWLAEAHAAIDQVWRMMTGREPPQAVPPANAVEKKSKDVAEEIDDAMRDGRGPPRQIETISAKRRRELQDIASTVKDLGTP